MRNVLVGGSVDQNDYAVITLVGSSLSFLAMRSVEMIQNGVRNRFSWTKTEPPANALDRDLWARLSDVLASIQGDRGILSVPDFDFEKPGVHVPIIRLYWHATANEVMTVIVRLPRLIGNVCGLLNERFNSFTGTLPDTGRAAAIALETIYLPVRNLAVAIDNLLRDHGEDLPADYRNVLNRVRDQVDEFELDQEATKFFLQREASTSGTDDLPMTRQRRAKLITD